MIFKNIRPEYSKIVAALFIKDESITFSKLSDILTSVEIWMSIMTKPVDLAMTSVHYVAYDKFGMNKKGKGVFNNSSVNRML